MSPARSFLFTGWEGGGNTPPVMTLVRRLRRRGHAVRLLGDASMRAEAERAGAEFLSWQAAPSRPDALPHSDPMRDWEATDPIDVLRRVVDRLMCGAALAYATDVAAELRRRPADAVVTSEMLLGAMIAAEAAGVPAAALGCNIPIVPLPGAPPFGPGFAPARTDEDRAAHAAARCALEALLDEGLADLNAARAAFGLSPLNRVFDQLGRLDRYLVATARAFDFEAESLPANLRYVGPLMDEPGWAGEAPPMAAGGAPRVVVAFSTTYQNQADVLRRIVQALRTLPVRAVVTTGPALAGEPVAGADNVTVVESASHYRLMAGAAAVVTHAGHGTVMRALLAGAPLLCLPMGRDQNDNAVRVTERGAGLQLSPDAAAEEIRTAVIRLLAEPGFRQAARQLGDAIASETDPNRTAVELERLAAPRAPRSGAGDATAAAPRLALAV